ncbi:uncharacterized protein LY89DRAFT_788167 [Mollisia scopiformis]|uniref:Uncharacterized protein n=1 Tax=Mollisia scopiformis TaxID=149040 RepID=A0A132BA39_MOLSC|nr:uncharacterized protein LY89DRAFT_788167 [Mollisia scopiformis]KUJ09272.1 hypothetical protein LY89DRAFT_788167 [Mollisia scopiformis]
MDSIPDLIDPAADEASPLRKVLNILEMYEENSKHPVPEVGVPQKTQGNASASTEHQRTDDVLEPTPQSQQDRENDEEEIKENEEEMGIEDARKLGDLESVDGLGGGPTQKKREEKALSSGKTVRKFRGRKISSNLAEDDESGEMNTGLEESQSNDEMMRTGGESSSNEITKPRNSSMLPLTPVRELPGLGKGSGQDGNSNFASGSRSSIDKGKTAISNATRGSDIHKAPPTEDGPSNYVEGRYASTDCACRSEKNKHVNVAVNQSPLEVVEPFELPPPLPSNMDNIPACIDDYMRNMYAHMCINQHNFEKLRLKCQRCNCNDPLPEPELTTQDFEEADEPIRANSPVGRPSWETMQQDDSTDWRERDENLDQESDEEMRKALQESLALMQTHDLIRRAIPKLEIIQRKEYVETHELDTMGMVLRYWEVSSGRRLSDGGSMAAVQDWLAIPRGLVESPPPLIQDVDRGPGHRLGEASSSAPPVDPETRGALTADSALKRGKKQSTQPSLQWRITHPQGEAQELPRNKRLPPQPVAQPRDIERRNHSEVTPRASRSNTLTPARNQAENNTVTAPSSDGERALDEEDESTRVANTGDNSSQDETPGKIWKGKGRA